MTLSLAAAIVTLLSLAVIGMLCSARVEDTLLVCQLPLRMPALAELPRWPDGDIPWTVSETVPPFQRDQLRRIYDAAWQSWARVCGIRPRYVDSVASARVVMGAGYIDGEYGILAWSEVPTRGTRQVEQRFDVAERWSHCTQCAPGTLDIQRVAAHEIGHAIGIYHIASGNLMQPNYSSAIRDPQDGDIREAVARYGPPLPAPPPGDGGLMDTLRLIIAAITCGFELYKDPPANLIDGFVAFIKCLAAKMGLVVTVADGHSVSSDIRMTVAQCQRE